MCNFSHLKTMKLEYFLFILPIVKVFGNISAYNTQHNKLALNAVIKDTLPIPSTCMQEAKCEPINNATCFGTTLPYAFTSFALAEDSISPLEIQDNLALWQGLRAVPRCWAVVQPLLCAIYMPKCENGTVYLPSQEMCKITRYPCRAVDIKHTWPAFLRCENKEYFPSGCRNPLQEVKFNTSSKCVAPLVETDNPDSWYDGVEGCGLQCQSPFFTSREHESTHGFIKVMASISFAMNVFTVLTFLVSWKNANRYPAVIIFYINVCLAVASFGWLIQFFSSVKEEIVCLPDGTVRRKQPRSGEHLCSITFILIYSFIIAALVWFVILTYAWHVFFKQSGVPKNIVKKKVAYFHLAAWCTPLVLTTTVMAMKEVDGDSMSGICFVGYANHLMRAGFLLVPVLASTLLGGFFLISGLCTLFKVKLGTSEVANAQVKKRIHHMIFKIGIFSLCCLGLVISTLGCHAYDFAYRSEFEEHLREYVVCLATSSTSSSAHPPLMPCTLKSRPNLNIVQLHLLSFFGFGILMASWVMNKSTLETWRRFFHKFCEPSEQGELAVKRHQLIAKAFQHRNQINQGHFSFSLNSTHDDPIGMNMEVNSIASRELSSTFALALPQFLTRRNAVPAVGPLGMKHYSSASDISARRISLDSFHQQNLDSLSLQISEQEYAHVLRHQRRKTRKEREKFVRPNRIAPLFSRSRRGSDTSLQSSILAASVVAAAAARVSATKVTKATSTGDLVAQAAALTAAAAAFARPPTSYVVNRQLPQKQAMPSLPFTHGMTDNSHSFSVNTRKRPPESGYLNPHNGFTSGNATTSHSPHAAFYNQVYGYVPPMPLGYMAGSLYPALNALCQNYLPFAGGNPNCVQYGESYMHFSQNPESLPDQNLIQLHPTMDSASEAEYLPIVLTDSEFTDGGHRSYDEAQLLTTQRLIQEHTLRNAVELERARSRQAASTQVDPQMQFPLNIITPNFAPVPNFSMQTDNFDALPAGKRSPHSEAPPPSPVDSETMEDNADCLHNESLPKSNSKQSLQLDTSQPTAKPSKEKGFFERIKSSIKRTDSVCHGLADTEDLELNIRSSRISLKYDSNEKKSEDGAAESLLGHASKKIDNTKLRTTDACVENISR